MRREERKRKRGGERSEGHLALKWKVTHLSYHKIIDAHAYVPVVPLASSSFSRSSFSQILSRGICET